MSTALPKITVDEFHRRLEAVERHGALQTLARVAAENGVSPEQVLGQTREIPVARARHDFWSLLHGSLGLTAVEIGRMTGRDRASVSKALQLREWELTREHAGRV